MSNSVKELDTEWVELILYALELGIPRDEISDFFKKNASTYISFSSKNEP